MPDIQKDSSSALQQLASKGDKEQHQRSKMVIYLTLGLVLIGLSWFTFWFCYLKYHQTTDDAYVNGDMIVITSVIPGTPIAFFADNTDLVKEGQLLIQLDPTAYQVAYDKELRGLAATILQVRQLYNSVHESEANVGVKQAQLATAQFNYDQRSRLEGTGGISEQEFNRTKDDLVGARKQLEQAQYQLKIAQDAAGNTTIEQHPLITTQRAVVRDAFYRLKHCSIYAPTTGYVAQLAVQLGQWASPNNALMAVIPLTHMWVDANYKETELTNMRIGQPAVVTFDIYGREVKYNGKVIGIGFGTGSVFSLIPPQNATGNWIKIVQRVPVRIGLDPEQIKQHPLRLGLSAKVDVNVAETNLPIVAQSPSTEAVATTSVFELSMNEVDALMEKILQDNLAPVGP